MDIAICDDNKLYIDMLKEIISEFMDKNEIDFNLDFFSSGEEFIKALDKGYSNYNLVFLDIIMDKVSGIEIAEILKKINENIEIIFVTTTKEFVFNGYDLGVLNYILKPFDKEKINFQIQRFIEKSFSTFDKKFSVKRKDGVEVFSIKDIMYFDIYNRIITLHSKSKQVQFYEKFEKVEKEVEKYNFLKCHRSYLVNCEYIEKIEGSDIYLLNGEQIPISRLKITKIKKEFLEFVMNN